MLSIRTEPQTAIYLRSSHTQVISRRQARYIRLIYLGERFSFQEPSQNYSWTEQEPVDIRKNCSELFT